MTRLFTFLILLLVIPLIYSCASSPKKLIRQDPLIGKIINTHTRKIISFTTMIDEITNHDVIYLSEKHDNPMHHAIQHRIIKTLVEKGKKPIIGFEFFSMEDTPLLLNFADSGKANHSKKIEAAMEKQIRRKLGWDSQSDTMWGYYYDLLKLARDNGLLISGLDLSTSQKRRITRKSMAGITDIEKKLIFSTHLTNEAYKTHMKDIFKAVHCGMGNEKMTSRLYDTWIARNDKMALSITQLKNTKNPIVVIIGNGHTEYKLGVMDRVKALDPDITQTNIGITEITQNPLGLEEYLHPLDLDGFESVSSSDYFWFTQRVSYKDPCEEFRASFTKMKKKKKKK